ncbi:hypothetical protein [Cohnella sp.]|uniref:hypothetical protein n=1 Tax=Cohnella sp. TaxID=1883426 RepID=UPI0035684E6B
MKAVPGLIFSIALIFASPTALSAETLIEMGRLGAAVAFVDSGTVCGYQDTKGTAIQVSSIKIEHNQAVHLRFNSDLQTNYTPDQWIALKASIAVSIDGGKTFKPLKASDQLQLTLKDPSNYWNLRTLSIKFADKFPKSGIIVKVTAKDTLQDVDGNSLAEDYLTPLLFRGMSLKLQSEEYITAGDPIQFVADQEGTVLLTQYLPADGTLEEYKEKSIRIVEVDKSRSGQLLTIETSEILPGNYRLIAWEGEDIPIGISVSPHIREDQVTFENYESGNDKITITGLHAGDKIHIYDDVYKPSQGWIEELYTIVVPVDQTSVIVQQFELDTTGQLVFLLEREGLLVSLPSILTHKDILIGDPR